MAVSTSVLTEESSDKGINAVIMTTSPVSMKAKLESPKSTQSHDTIPLNSTLRTNPIHPSLPAVKLPHNASSNESDIPPHPSTLHPVTLKPLTPAELTSHNFEALLAQFENNPNAARKARDDTVAELKARMQENERRSREVEREMEEKEKTREIERKVYMKKLGRDGG